MNKYSVLDYMQKKVAIQCDHLPQSFNSIREFENYREMLREKLNELLPVLPSSLNGEAIITGSHSLSSDLILETIELMVDESLVIPVHLYKKKGISTSPAVIICPGYGTPMNTDFYVSFAMRLAREGIIAVVPEYSGTGEASERPDYSTAINNIVTACHLLGMNEAGIRVSVNLSLYHYLKSREEVNGRIGITGLCQGSIITAYTVALENGFTACAPLCGATTYEAEVTEYASRQGGWSGVSPFVFNILKYADFPQLFACYAPKPMLIQNNMTDIHWPLSGFLKVKKVVKGVYTLYDKKDSIECRIEHAPHAYQGEHSDNIIKFFIKELA